MYICYVTYVILRCVIYEVRRYCYDQCMVNRVDCRNKYTLSATSWSSVVFGAYDIFSRNVWKFRRRFLWLKNELYIVFIRHYPAKCMICYWYYNHLSISRIFCRLIQNFVRFSNFNKTWYYYHKINRQIVNIHIHINIC